MCGFVSSSSFHIIWRPFDIRELDRKAVRNPLSLSLFASTTFIFEPTFCGNFLISFHVRRQEALRCNILWFCMSLPCSSLVVTTRFGSKLTFSRDSQQPYLNFFSVSKCKQNKTYLLLKIKKIFLLFEICNLTLQFKSRYKYSNHRHLANGIVSH